MYRYSAFSLAIHSEIELPELQPADAEADVIFRLGPVPKPNGKATPEAEIIFNDEARFLITEGREIRVDLLPGANPRTVRSFLLGRIMAFLLRQRGYLPLHASGVAIGGRGVLFIGRSGEGKSTTAAAFHLRGHTVFTDDVAAIEVASGQCRALLGNPWVRLLEDSGSLLESLGLQSELQKDKVRFDFAYGSLPRQFPLKQIFILAEGDSLRIEPIPPLQIVTQLNGHSWVKHRRVSTEVLDAVLRDCAAVAAATTVRRLVRPRSLAALPSVVTLVEKEMGTAQAG